jgi:hypothetical protein
MNKEDEFKQLFGEIEDYLNKIVRSHGHESFPSLVDKAGQKYPVVRNNAKDLRSLADVGTERLSGEKILFWNSGSAGKKRRGAG